MLIHHFTSSARIGDTELVLGRTTRAGTFDASFNATALLDSETNRCRRLLMCRNPEVEFPES